MGELNNGQLKNVLFFDGVCGLCNGFVSLLVKIDKRRILKFAPLQGQTASKLLNTNAGDPLISLVFYDGEKFYDRSIGVVELLSKLGPLWSTAKFFYLVPLPLRNWLYDLVAKHRYSLFGKHESCRVPTPSELEQFLP